MKIIRNIPGMARLLFSLKCLSDYRKEIDAGNSTGDVEREKKAILGATITWGNYLVKHLKISVNVKGQENIPTQGPVVYVCNHQGYADIPILCSVLDKIQFSFIAKENLSSLPFYGDWIKRIRGIMMERDDPRESLKAISKGVGYINQGFSLLIFPEGTRAKSSNMGEFKKGALKLATKPGVPVVPITINGSYNVFETTGVMQSASVDVIVHPQIETKDISREEEKHLSDKIYKIIEDGLETLK